MDVTLTLLPHPRAPSSNANCILGLGGVLGTRTGGILT